MTLLQTARLAIETSPHLGYTQEISSIKLERAYSCPISRYDTDEFSTVIFFTSPKEGIYNLDIRAIKKLCPILKGLFEPLRYENLHGDMKNRVLSNYNMMEPEILTVDTTKGKKDILSIGCFTLREIVGVNTQSYELFPDYWDEFEYCHRKGSERMSDIYRDITFYLFPCREVLELWEKMIHQKKVNRLTLEEKLGLLITGGGNSCYSIDISRYNQLFNGYA